MIYLPGLAGPRYAGPVSGTVWRFFLATPKITNARRAATPAEMLTTMPMISGVWRPVPGLNEVSGEVEGETVPRVRVDVVMIVVNLPLTVVMGVIGLPLTVVISVVN